MDSRISVLEGDVKQAIEEKERKEDHKNYRFTRMESRISVLEGDVYAISQKVNKFTALWQQLNNKQSFCHIPVQFNLILLLELLLSTTLFQILYRLQLQQRLLSTMNHQ